MATNKRIRKKREKAKAQASETSKQYAKELARVKKLLNSLKKRGYTLPKSLTKLTEKKKRPTKKSVEALKNVTGKTVYKKAKYKTESGKIIAGEERRKQERSEAGKKGWEKRKKPTIGGVGPTEDFYEIAYSNFLSSLYFKVESGVLSNGRGAEIYFSQCEMSINIVTKRLEELKEKIGVKAVVEAIQAGGTPSAQELYEGRISLFLTQLENYLFKNKLISEKDFKYLGKAHDEEDTFGYEIPEY